MWSPDGKQLAYASGTRLYLKDVGGASDAKLIKDVGQPFAVTDWTHDGRVLIYGQAVPGGADTFAIPVQGEPAPVLVTEGGGFARISPDGRWVAYISNRSGRVEVYVRPFTAPGAGSAPSGPVIQISANGGTFPK